MPMVSNSHSISSRKRHVRLSKLITVFILGIYLCTRPSESPGGWNSAIWLGKRSPSLLSHLSGPRNSSKSFFYNWIFPSFSQNLNICKHWLGVNNFNLFLYCLSFLFHSLCLTYSAEGRGVTYLYPGFTLTLIVVLPLLERCLTAHPIIMLSSPAHQ